MTNQDLFKGIMLTDALRTIVNKLFYEKIGRASCRERV